MWPATYRATAISKFAADIKSFAEGFFVKDVETITEQDKPLGDKGLMPFIKHVEERKHSNLKELALVCVYIGDDTMKGLSGVLDKMPVLKKLDLHDNFITNKGVSEFAVSISSPLKEFKILNINDNLCGLEGLLGIVTNIDKLPALTRLKVRNNAIGNNSYLLGSKLKELGDKNVIRVNEQSGEIITLRIEVNLNYMSKRFVEELKEKLENFGYIQFGYLEKFDRGQRYDYSSFKPGGSPPFYFTTPLKAYVKSIPSNINIQQISPTVHKQQEEAKIAQQLAASITPSPGAASISASRVG